MFKGGYLITSEDSHSSNNTNVNYISTHWEKKKIDSLFCLFDPDLDAYSYDKQQATILLLGIVLDPLNAIDCPETILTILLNKYLRSEEEFFNYVDILTGRFIILVASPNKRFIFQDATGNRSLFYHKSSDEIFVASHAQLIAEIKNYEIPQEREDFVKSESYKRNVRHFPGILTPYPNIFVLTPNTLLDLDKLEIKRFFPHERIKQQEISLDLVDEVSNLFRKQVQMLCKKRKLSVSLTAGIDSRLTLAATKEFKNLIFYYTYVTKGNSEHEKDAYYAQKICNYLKIEHHLLSANETAVCEDDWEFLKVFRRNTAYMRADSQGMLANALFKKHPKNCLHLKSNVAEISRAFYRKKVCLPPKYINPLLLSRLYGINPASLFCIDAFKDFIEITNFKKASTFDYDFYDLFYWEHRLGCWQSLQILDFDMSQDTFILYNNRYILNKMLSVSLKERVKNTLYCEIIKRLWPEALRIPCNPWTQASGVKKLTGKMRKLAKGVYLRFKL